MAMFEASDRDPGWTTSIPITYNIDYSANHVGNDEYIRMIADAPPVLLHVGHDVPFKSMYGPNELFHCFGEKMLGPREVDERIGVLTEYVRRLHDAGVRLVIPYICSMFIFGDAKKRTGFWQFYDSWEKYYRFGFGSRPRKDPLSWCCEKPRKLDAKGFDAGYVYEPCISNPDWRRFLRTVVGHIAEVGYDGVFSDVNSSRCQKACCRRLFAEYLAARYTSKEIRDLFGFEAPSKVRLGREGEGLLWLETVRFRGERIATLFAELRNEGRKHRDTFIVTPNLSPFQHVDGVWKRVGNTHHFGAWARECPIIMFEEMQQPGLFRPGVVSNFAFQYKYAFAHASRAGCLLYHATDPSGVHIAIAEAAAGGGGAFIQGHYSCPEVRKEYRAFFSAHGDLFEGYAPHSPVGLVFSYDQLAWGTRSHLENAFRIAEELMAQHVLFDIVAERSLRIEALRRYSVLIASDLENLSSTQVKALLGFMQEGGWLLATGNLGAFDERGRRRRGGAFATIPASSWSEIGRGLRRASFRKGGGLKADRLDRLLSPSPFEIFLLSEEECNDINKIFELMSKSEPAPPACRELLPEMRKVAGELSISDSEETLRFNAYKRMEPGRMAMTLHAVNYNLPIRARGQSGPIAPAKDVRVMLPLPDGFEVGEAVLYNPPSDGRSEVAFNQDGRSLLLEIPVVETYAVAQVLPRG